MCERFGNRRSTACKSSLSTNSTLQGFFQYYTTYTNAADGSPMERGDDCSLSTNYSTYVPQCPSGLHQEAKSFLVTRSYYTVNEPNIHLKGIARLKEKKWE
jgi:hypothetical protein